MAHRYYVNCPLGVGPVSITGSEAHHLANVLRARAGDAVCLFNGDGAEYPAIIASVEKRQVAVEVTDRCTPKRELDFRLEVAVPLPKGDRGDFLIEKLTELGVTCFVPLRTQRSIVHPKDSSLKRLERAVIEASKQCGRNVLMDVGPMTTWHQYIGRNDLPAVRVLADPGGSALGNGGPRGDAVVAIGPEGGFTAEEVAEARAAGWQIVGLGPRILRMETAAVLLAARFAG